MLKKTSKTYSLLNMMNKAGEKGLTWQTLTCDFRIIMNVIDVCRLSLSECRLIVVLYCIECKALFSRKFKFSGALTLIQRLQSGNSTQELC